MTVDTLAAQVRAELTRRDDLLVDLAELRQVVDAVVHDRHERWLGGFGAPLSGPPDVVAEDLFESLAGFGQLSGLMSDDSVEEIWINGPSRVFVARQGEHHLTTVVLAPDELEDLVERLLASAGRRLDRSTPFVDARMPGGSRLHVVIPPVTTTWSVNIRKFVGLKAHNLVELVEVGSLERRAAAFLDAAVRAGLNIAVCGPVGAGKTTLLNCLAGSIPTRERVVTCEEVFELDFGLPDVVAMQCRQANSEGRGEITLRGLVREALRMRPDRLVIGEVRGAEAFDLLIALNSGCSGLTSVHANSASEALRKLVTLPLLAGGNIDRRFVAETVAATVDIVVHCERRVDTGARRVREVLAVGDQLAGEGRISAGPVFTLREGELRWTGEIPRRLDRFYRAGIDVDTMLRAGAA